MKKIAARLAILIPAAAAASVLAFSSVSPSRAELQGVGSPGLPPPPPKSCVTVVGTTPDGMLVLSNGMLVAADGTISTLP